MKTAIVFLISVLSLSGVCLAVQASSGGAGTGAAAGSSSSMGVGNAAGGGVGGPSIGGGNSVGGSGSSMGIGNAAGTTETSGNTRYYATGPGNGAGSGYSATGVENYTGNGSLSVVEPSSLGKGNNGNNYVNPAGSAEGTGQVQSPSVDSAIGSNPSSSLSTSGGTVSDPDSAQ